jgi:ABC-type multidrug transport system fused ATPase/permease subunit
MRYRDDLPLVLSSVDLHIKAGEKVAIVGKTGSGKTSLVQALFRLYPIEQGILKVGGKSADTGAGGVSLTKYRSSMAYITQQATLFLGTIRTNLDSSGLIEDEMLIEALRRVQFLEATSTHGDYKRWLDFPISENGSNLSVGERQLICMARCLLQDAPVVILDEATSSVDPKSEEIITKATDEFFKGKTLLIIAHRLSTIQSCDRVVWLQNGRVHKSGSPKEILPEFKATNLDV